MRFLAAALILSIVLNGCSATRPVPGSGDDGIDWESVRAEALGKNVSLTLADGTRATGKLESVDTDGILLKPVPGRPPVRYPLADIANIELIHTHAGRSLLLAGTGFVVGTFLFVWIMIATMDKMS